MVQREASTERAAKPLPFDLMSSEFAAMGKERIEDFVNAQAELFENLQESSKQWLDRVKSETDLASELASKLTAARSIPDALTAYQQWTKRRFEMMAEDSKHLLADTQRLMETGARFLSNGAKTKSGGTST